jgi:hypothetical protein
VKSKNNQSRGILNPTTSVRSGEIKFEAAEQLCPNFIPISFQFYATNVLTFWSAERVFKTSTGFNM